MYAVIDTETSTAEWIEKDGRARVWLWDICDENLAHETGTDLDALMERVLKENKGETRKRYYVHNLKYDGQYIVCWLYNHGFEYSDKRMPYTFRSLITDTGVWYSIDITTRVHGKNEVGCTIYDSMKLFPVSEENIAKAYELPIAKGSIDYTRYREEGYEPTPEEVEYVQTDTEIISRALKLIRQDGLDRNTLASCALSCYKSMIGKKKFDYWFPKMDIEVDDFVRHSYKGGYTYLNPKYTGKELENLIVLDINSMYPAAMVQNPLPYAIPIQGEGAYEHNKRYPLYIQELSCQFRLKPGKLPSIQLKNNMRFIDTEYLRETKGEAELLWLTKPDLELFFENYDVWELDYIRWVAYRGQFGMFDDYILYWYEIKSTSEGSKKLSAKLYLNSLYGKLASNPRKRSGKPILTEEGFLKIEAQPETLEEPISTEKAAFITAYCRARIIRDAQKLGDKFVYTDTDSIHFIAENGVIPDDLPLDEVELGQYKIEKHIFWAKFLRPKTYMEFGYDPHKKKKPSMDKKICGCPAKVKQQVTAERFNIGEEFEGKLCFKRVRDGVVLEPRTFTIKER